MLLQPLLIPVQNREKIARARTNEMKNIYKIANEKMCNMQ